VPDVKVEQKQSLSREDAARFVAALAEGLADDGRVTVELGSSSLQLSVGGHVDCELEVSVDGDEVELELELKWSISGRTAADTTQDEEADELEADEADDDESEADDVESEADEPEGEPDEDASDEDASDEDASDENASEQDAATEASAVDGGAEENDASPSEAETAPPAGQERSAAAERSAAPGRSATPERSASPRRSRRNAAAGTGKPASNGVDTAAVRAWAAANGVSVSPRGRIRDEVLEAYRAAGN